MYSDSRPPRLPTCTLVDRYVEGSSQSKPAARGTSYSIVDRPCRGPDADCRFAWSFYAVATKRCGAGGLLKRHRFLEYGPDIGLLANPL